jgi:hypothetical protein
MTGQSQWSVLMQLKIKLSTYLSSIPLRLTQGVEVRLHTFLSLAFDIGEWSGLCFDCFIPNEIMYPLDTRMDKPQSWYVHGDENNKKNLCPCWELYSR